MLLSADGDRSASVLFVVRALQDMIQTRANSDSRAGAARLLVQAADGKADVSLLIRGLVYLNNEELADKILGILFILSFFLLLFTAQI